ncbi:MAG: hypothetical protein ACI4PF_00775 [Christensenellales bacterium]
MSQAKIDVDASTRYARVESSTEIFRNMSDSNNISNVICIAEKSYFVEIIGNYDNFFRVNYNGINGYVKKNDVKEISNTPSTPYPFNIKITIGSNCNLRSTPTTKSETNNIIATLYTDEQNFTFIGRIFSEEAIDFGGSTWYLVNYQGTYGYIYNKYVKSITPIYENTEEVIYLSTNVPKTENPITHTPSLILIIVLLIPCILILLILYLPKKHLAKPKPKKSPRIFDRY